MNIRSAIQKFEEINAREKFGKDYFENINHEYRTSMNAIMGFAQILNNGGISREETECYTGVICCETEHLLKVFNELLSNLKKVSDSSFSHI